MQQYGKKKRRGGVPGHGHNNCKICKPDIETKVGRRKARNQGKKDASRA